MKSCKIDTCVSLDLKNIAVECPRMISLGIDVSRDTLSICELYSDGRQRFKEILNTEISIKRVAARLADDNFSGKIIMESTGRHHMLSAIVFSESGLDARVINPLIAKKYSTASIRKIKTDKRDSAILAEIGIKESDLPSRFSLSRKELALRKKMSLIYTVSKQLHNLNTCLNEHRKTLKGISQPLSVMEKEICKTAKQLQRQKDLLEKDLEKDILANEDNAAKSERYNSIPGVSAYVAALAALNFSDEHSQDAKQWIAFLGLDISIRQSGTWNGKGSLTKRGNNYLRMRLYSAAWGAVRHNEKFKAYYDFLKRKNRKHKEALIMIARKIINIMFRINRDNLMFSEAKLILAA